MGADVIYTYRRLLPRLLVFILFWSLSMFVPFMLNLPPWWPFWFIGDFAVFLLFVGFEFRRVSRLVRGTIDNVPISELTKAIYWLSIVSSRKVPSQEFSYQKRATRVANKIGGTLKIAWDEILEKHHLSNPTRSLLIIAGGFICCFGTIVTYALHAELVSDVFAGLAVILLLAVSITLKKGRENLESLVKDEEATKRARWLTEKLISWVSERIEKPLQVMLTEGDYSNIKVVGSVYGAIIAEIEPKDTLPEHKTKDGDTLQLVRREPTPARDSQEKWEPLWVTLVFIGFISSLALLKISIPLLNWVYGLSYGSIGDILVLIAAIIVVSLPFIPIELFFRKKRLNSSILVVVAALLIFLGIPTLEWIGLSEKMAWMTFFSTSIIVLTAVFVVLLYLAFPFLEIVFRGGVIRPSDLERIIKRVPARTIKKLMKQDEKTGQRFYFLKTAYSKGIMPFSEVSDSVMEWIKEDAKQPENLRYFSSTDNSVSLTEMGKTLAKALLKKLR